MDEIRAFIRCVELGGLSAAARSEGLPKSSLSRLLRQLEDTVGARLLERTTRGVRPTPEGYAFLSPARRILEEVDRARASVDYFRDRPQGLIRITAPYTFGVTFIGPLLPPFLAANPGIDVQLELTSRNIDIIQEGFDLAVRIGEAPASTESQRLTVNRAQLMASPAYLRLWGEPATPGDLVGRPLLLIGAARAPPSLTLTRGGDRVVVATAPRLQSSDPTILIQAAAAGVGIGQIPLILVGEKLAAGELTPVLRDWSLPAVDINLIRARGMEMTPRVRAFAAYLHERLGEILP
jgi:DNA-binding transcriptional LysR family regulator